MAELSLKIGDAETDTQEAALFMFSLSSVLQWFFFIIVAIIVAKYIKKKNANSFPRDKHS